jgi:hypothetical protein
MKRCLFYFATAIVGVGGFFLVLCGMLFLSSAPAGPARSNWWRVVSGGMIMMGIYALLNLKRIPDHVAAWVKRYFAPIYTLFWFIAGCIIFILSWF